MMFAVASAKRLPISIRNIPSRTARKDASPIVNVGSKMCHAMTHANWPRDRRTGLGRITSFIRKRVEKGRLCPQTVFFEWSIVPTWLPRPQRGTPIRGIIRGRRLRRGRSQVRFSGKGEGVPRLSERSCEFRYVGIPVIWRRRDTQTLRPTGNGRIVDRLDIDGVAL